MESISKVLSENDVGKTGAHQAGILVPKDTKILSFFPALDKKSLNPRVLLTFQDDGGELWQFAFIYYNNSFFGGTRNEYRLTRMTKFLRDKGLKAGDEIILEKHKSQATRIKYKRTGSAQERKHILKLGANWKIISF
jgi:hypothetical protein